VFGEPPRPTYPVPQSRHPRDRLGNSSQIQGPTSGAGVAAPRGIDGSKDPDRDLIINTSPNHGPDVSAMGVT